MNVITMRIIYFIIYHNVFAAASVFQLDTSLRDVICDANNVVMSSLVRSVVECQTLCDVNVRCMSTFYTSSSEKCIGCKVVYNSSAGLTKLPGTVYYRKNAGPKTRTTCARSTMEEFRGSCYIFNGRSLERHEAQAKCRDQRGHLVDIATSEEMVFLTQMYFSQHTKANERVWIGAFSAHPSAPTSYLWTNGVRVIRGYNNLQHGHHFSSCVYFDASRSFVWGTSSCGQRYASICEMSARA